MANLTIPSIHLNGTAGTELMRQLKEAVAALRLAREKLDAAAPNARDYYPQGPGAYQQAEAEHRSRADRLRSVVDELTEIWQDVHDQIQARRRR